MTADTARIRAQPKTVTDSYKFDNDQLHGAIFDSGKSLATWLSVGLVGFLMLFMALAAVHIFSPGLKPSDIADHDLTAPESTQVVDKSETAKAVERAKQSIVPVFQVDKSRNAQSRAAVDRSLDRIGGFQAYLVEKGLMPAAVPAPKTNLKAARATRGLKTASEPSRGEIALPPQALILAEGDNFAGLAKDVPPPVVARAQTLHSALKAFRQRENGLFDSEAIVAMTVPTADFSVYRKSIDETANRLIKKFHRFPVADRKLWEDIVIEFLPENMPEALKQNSAAVLAQGLEPNLVIDPESTRSKAAEAVKTIKPVMRSFTAGDIIVPQGSIINKEQIEVLQALGVTHVNRWPFVLSMAVSLIAALTLVALYLYTYEPKHFFAASSLGLMYTVAIVVCALAAIIGKSYPQFVPLPAMALILTIFFGNRVAVVITMPILMLVAVDRLLDMHHLVAYVLASMVAVFSYSKGRNAVLTTAVFIAVAQVVGDLAACAMDQSIVSWHMLARKLGLDFIGGIASSILAIGSLPFLENIFGLITPFRIAELTDANQPLLKRLEENAPGTYQHSLAVANLAEAGAKAIAADANLVRAGALYHDIGKMVRPKYFIENQLGATNPHDSMAPEDSRARVLAHVTDGIALAEKYALPKAIQDFIPMHQGTTLMAYFYHKACVRDGAENVDASFYRYPGPRPNSKETAIVMLADVSEAVTHSMRDPSQEEVETALEKVFQNRWDDGQFKDANLSYDELVKVRAGFARVWRTLHHERLKYPATTTGKMPMAPQTVSGGHTGGTTEEASAAGASNNGSSSGTGSNVSVAEPVENGLGI